MEALGSIWQVAFALILVIAVVLGLGYAAKKTRLVKTGGAGALKIVDSAYLGPKERLVLVQVGDRQVLIGMNAQVITALTQITNAGEFSATLQQVQNNSSHQTDAEQAPAQETQP